MTEILPPKVKEFSATKQRRLDESLEKNSEETITPAEKARLEQLVAEAEQLMVANAQVLDGSSKLRRRAQWLRRRARHGLGDTGTYGALKRMVLRGDVPATCHGARGWRVRVLPTAEVGNGKASWTSGA